MKISLPALIGAWIGTAMIFGMAGYMAGLFPEAAHVETLNQRAIAAGSWKHQAGLHDYLAFVEKNK